MISPWLFLSYVKMWEMSMHKKSQIYTNTMEKSTICYLTDIAQMFNAPLTKIYSTHVCEHKPF